MALADRLGEIEPVADWQLFTQAERLDMYMDWVNNFLTTDYFAEYYHITVECAKQIITNEQSKAGE